MAASVRRNAWGNVKGMAVLRQSPSVSLFSSGVQIQGPCSPSHTAPRSQFQHLDGATGDVADRVRALMDQWYEHLPDAAQPTSRRSVPQHRGLDEPRRVLGACTCTSWAGARTSARCGHIGSDATDERCTGLPAYRRSQRSRACAGRPWVSGRGSARRVRNLNVCPMRTPDLGRLLVGVAVSGPWTLPRRPAMLRSRSPRGRVSVTIAELVEALEDLDNIDRLDVGTLATRMRQRRKERDLAHRARTSEEDVRTLLGGRRCSVPPPCCS